MKENNITITMRQLSIIVSAGLIAGFFIFISGYFLGKKRAAEEFSYRIDQESLADQIYSSMCILSDTKDESDEDEENSDENEISEMAKQSEPKNEMVTESSAKPTENQKNYKITLAGFSAAQSEEASKMVARLSKKGYGARVVEIESKTPKGKSVTWYQVTAQVCANPGDLPALQQEIAKVAQVNKKSIKID